jgi:hypothetical protein
VSIAEGDLGEVTVRKHTMKVANFGDGSLARKRPHPSFAKIAKSDEAFSRRKL